MLFLDFDYVTLSPSLTFSFLVAQRDRELLPGFPGKACRDKDKLILFRGKQATACLRLLSQGTVPGHAGPEDTLSCAWVFCLPWLQLTCVQGQGRRASRHSSNNNYFISPEHHTQLQMALTEVSYFNENFISHVKHCL